ncbi:MAG: hypothetical protein ACRCUY_01795 [Thermoguttaceae bacterium]
MAIFHLQELFIETNTHGDSPNTPPTYAGGSPNTPANLRWRLAKQTSAVRQT